MQTTTQTTLFDTLCAQLHAEPDRKGEVWVACPQCSRENKHFSFSEEHGAHCFGCDFSGSLAQVAELLSIQPDDRARPVRRVSQPQAPRQWQQRPEYYLERYCGALDRVTCWQAYKPLSLDSIARYRLGVGVLPSSRCTRRRLILPIFDGGQCVALHGRAYLPQDTEAKWLSAGGSSKQVLFNADRLTPGATVAIVENFIDALLMMQVEPGVVAVAGGGASWRDEWTAQIAQRRPRAVLVLLDNDLAGWPNEPTYHTLSAQWRRERPGLPVPEPRGPKIASALLAAGVRSVRGPNWPRGTPAKYDIGADLMRGGMSS
jgi:hypothetical protein